MRIPLVVLAFALGAVFLTEGSSSYAQDADSPDGAAAEPAPEAQVEPPATAPSDEGSGVSTDAAPPVARFIQGHSFSSGGGAGVTRGGGDGRSSAGAGAESNAPSSSPSDEGSSLPAPGDFTVTDLAGLPSYTGPVNRGHLMISLVKKWALRFSAYARSDFPKSDPQWLCGQFQAGFIGAEGLIANGGGKIAATVAISENPGSFDVPRGCLFTPQETAANTDRGGGNGLIMPLYIADPACADTIKHRASMSKMACVLDPGKTYYVNIAGRCAPTPGDGNSTYDNCVQNGHPFEVAGTSWHGMWVRAGRLPEYCAAHGMVPSDDDPWNCK
jgi:hypothetical protein